MIRAKCMQMCKLQYAAGNFKQEYLDDVGDLFHCPAN